MVHTEAGCCEFVCRACDCRVLAYGIDTPPANSLCSVCNWIEVYVPEAEREEYRKRFRD